MATLKNVSPLGALDFPLLGRVIGAGETFEVDQDTADRLLEQVGNFEAVTGKSTKKSEG